MVWHRSRIAVLICGATALASTDAEENIVNSEADIEAWRENLAELSVLANVDVFFLTNKSGEGLRPAFWQQLAKEIIKRNRYDGYVVLHEVETIAYTGAALAFLLRGLGKPVVLTGAFLSPEKSGVVRWGVRDNLMNAIQATTMDIAEVGLLFGNHLIRAVRAVRDYTSFNAFYGLSGEILGQMDFCLRLDPNRLKREQAKPLSLQLEEQVTQISLSPAVPYGTGLVDQVRAMIIDTPTPLLLQQANFWLNKIVGQVPVVIFSPKQKIKELPGTILVSQMTREALLLKIMWLLPQVKNQKEFYNRLKENLIGELGPI